MTPYSQRSQGVGYRRQVAFAWVKCISHLTKEQYRIINESNVSVLVTEYLSMQTLALRIYYE